MTKAALSVIILLPYRNLWGFLLSISANVCAIGVILSHMPITFWILVALTFIFTYVNGFHDGCNVVATLIASRSMRPYPALAWAAVVEVLSPFAILAIGSSVSEWVAVPITSY